MALYPMGNFDIDLDFGLMHEYEVKDIFEGKGSIEVKTERDIWTSTGNMVIEIACRNKPSGISITEAEWWCHLFTVDGEIKFIVMMKVKELKERIKELARTTNLIKKVNGGDDNASEMLLIPVKHLVGYSWK